MKIPNTEALTAAAPADHNRTVARDRRVVRTEDLSAELDRPGISVVELGVEFCRRLRARGLTAEGKLADKAFRDGLYEDT